jgi:hypothetical protein
MNAAWESPAIEFNALLARVVDGKADTGKVQKLLPRIHTAEACRLVEPALQGWADGLTSLATQFRPVPANTAKQTASRAIGLQCPSLFGPSGSKCFRIQEKAMRGPCRSLASPPRSRPFSNRTSCTSAGSSNSTSSLRAHVASVAAVCHGRAEKTRKRVPLSQDGQDHPTSCSGESVAQCSAFPRASFCGQGNMQDGNSPRVAPARRTCGYVGDCRHGGKGPADRAFTCHNQRVQRRNGGRCRVLERRRVPASARRGCMPSASSPWKVQTTVPGTDPRKTSTLFARP